MALGKPAVVGKKPNGAASSSNGPRISSRPSDAVSGGGAPDNVDVTVTECRAVSDFDYNGTQEPSPALYVKFKDNQSGAEYEQHYTAGKLNRLVAHDSGEYFVPAEGSSAAGMTTGCNAFMFLAALTEKGFPEDKLDQFSNVVGLSGHLNAVAPKRSEGFSSKPVAIFTKIHKMPWEQGKAVQSARSGSSTTKGTQTTATGSASNGNGDGDGDDETIAAVVNFLQANGGSHPRKTIGIGVFKANPKMDSKTRSGILKTLQNDEWFETNADRFVNDGETVTLLD